MQPNDNNEIHVLQINESDQFCRHGRIGKDGVDDTTIMEYPRRRMYRQISYMCTFVPFEIRI
jgi:hypothetical protein